MVQDMKVNIIPNYSVMNNTISPDQGSVCSGITTIGTTTSSTTANTAEIVHKSNPSNNVVAENAVNNPEFSQALFCIACILQSNIFDDTFKVASRRASQPMAPAVHSEFEMYTLLPTHLGGLQHPATIPHNILAKETQNDPELLEKILNGEVPTVDTILRFLAWLHESAAYSSECNIMAFVYLKRLMNAGKIELTATNWRGLWVGAVTVAQKMWDDTPLRTSSFAKVLPGVCKIQLRDMEMKVFTLLEFSAHVKPQEYNEQYFELREIYKCLVGENKPSQQVVPPPAPQPTISYPQYQQFPMQQPVFIQPQQYMPVNVPVVPQYSNPYQQQVYMSQPMA
eukprot:CAMPEP_0117526128 /NCGR_PEP_ID=MMETSP0784-20121206/36127_1 /TAXON_ID=39447 /ORGANISM="" /LENGTH=338 /DNA_ID=CAMNT_0005322349 /DNA_START=17 /DNA_END=1030 /DNA_ORIENTATION=-